MPSVNPRLVLEGFEHPNYGGRSGFFIEPLQNMRRAGFPNGIRSAKVYRGPGFKRGPNFRCVLYEQPEYRGRKLALAPGFYPSLLDMSAQHSGNVASLNFSPEYETAGPEWGTVPVIVEIYEDPNFTGRRATALRDVANTHTKFGMVDTISSVRVWKGPDFPPGGAMVRLFENIDLSETPAC